MSSYQSSTSFGGRSSSDESSTYGTSPTVAMGSHMAQHNLEPLPENANDTEPLDHPVLSTYHRDTVVPDRWGNTMMQTKSAWLKQMAHFDKEDAKKAKKEARKAKHHPVVIEAPKGKKEKKKAKHEGEYDDE